MRMGKVRQIKTSKKALIAVLAILISIILIFFSMLVLLTPEFIEYEYSKQDFPKSTRFTNEERLNYAKIIFRFITSKESSNFFNSMNEKQSVITEKEILHLVDVQSLTLKFLFFSKMSMIAAAYIWLLTYHNGKEILLKSIKYASIAMLSILVSIFIASFLSFDLFFLWFHQILFKENTWVFEEGSMLMQLFPKKIWVDATFAIIAICMIEIGILIAVVIIIQKTNAFRRKD